jgi:hypothetical protein
MGLDTGFAVILDDISLDNLDKSGDDSRILLVFVRCIVRNIVRNIFECQ